jgi:hypothetical protein
VVRLDFSDIGKALKRFEQSAAQISILVITLVLYLLIPSPQNTLFGVLVAVELIGFVLLEVQQGVSKHGLGYEILDTIKSLGVAVLIWLLVSTALGTTVPVSAVVSCSMLPSIQRGDLAIVRGANLDDVTAPLLRATTMDIEDLKSSEVVVSYPAGSFKVVGSLYSYCQLYLYRDSRCREFYAAPGNFTEHKGGFEFAYSTCERVRLGANTKVDAPCLYSVKYANRTVYANRSNSVIVYQPNAGDLFFLTGDIIHRAFVKIRAPDGSSYVLTKGDNNDVLDLQFYDYSRMMGNTPVVEKNVKGMDIAGIPYIGYFKLFISGFLVEDPNCGTNLNYV